jgi:hypothetical protein
VNGPKKLQSTAVSNTCRFAAKTALRFPLEVCRSAGVSPASSGTVPVRQAPRSSRHSNQVESNPIEPWKNNFIRHDHGQLGQQTVNKRSTFGTARDIARDNSTRPAPATRHSSSSVGIELHLCRPMSSYLHLCRPKPTFPAVTVVNLVNKRSNPW